MPKTKQHDSASLSDQIVILPNSWCNGKNWSSSEKWHWWTRSPPWLVCRDSCTNFTTQSSSDNTQNLKFGFGFILILNNETYGCHSKLCIPSIYFCLHFVALNVLEIFRIDFYSLANFLPSVFDKFKKFPKNKCPRPAIVAKWLNPSPLVLKMLTYKDIFLKGLKYIDLTN